MKSFKKFTALVMAMSAVFFGFSTAVAAESVSDGKSNANIEFEEGDGSEDVVDPEKPEEDYDDENPDEGDPDDDPTGDSGALTLDYVSSVDFGEHKVSTKTETYKAETLRPFIQVSDKRGTAEGWSVTAQASSFTDSYDEQSLNGSTLSFLNGDTSSKSTADAPKPSSEVALSAGGDSALVVNAAEDTGMGKWTTHWIAPDKEAGQNDNVTLNVPGGSATQGEHTATVDWTLADAPQ